MKNVDPKMAELFADNFTKLGDVPQAVHWGSDASAKIRYQAVLDTLGDLSGLSIMDIGGGLGHLYEHVRSQGQLPLTWTNVEMTEDFVRACRQKFKFDNRFITIPGNFMEAELPGEHFHAALLVGTISLVDPKDLPAWLTRLERDVDIDCYMIEFLREGVSEGPFHKYNIKDIQTMMKAKDYEYKITFHELPHVFNLYAWPHKMRKELRPKWKPSRLSPELKQRELI